MTLRVLDLFSGIGGFSLGLERTGGFRTVAFCEIEPYCRAVLKKHWPDVPCYDDVRTLTADALERDGIAVDVICGGFPCQDISFAGIGAGLAGERSGLWREYARLIRELRPRFVIVENVAALLGRGLDSVLGDLAAFGFDAEWHCIPACAVGAPHRRDRIWIVAYPGSKQHKGDSNAIGRALSAQLYAADAVSIELRQQSGRRDGARRTGQAQPAEYGQERFVAHADGGDGYRGRSDVQMGRQRVARETPQDGHASRAQWLTEPDVGRVAHGVPSRVDRLRGLGNAVVPQIPELIGRAILQAQRQGDRTVIPTEA